LVVERQSDWEAKVNIPVVPANAGTHSHRLSLLKKAVDQRTQ